MRRLLITLLSFFGATLFAVESATLTIKTKTDTQSKVYQAMRIDEKTTRIRIPKNDIPENYEWFEVLADNAIAEIGEEGFWIFGRGEMGTFRVKNGAYMNKVSQIPIFGMKTPRETFLGIVKGMQFDMLMCVDSIDGIYKLRPRWNFKHMGYQPYEDVVIDFITLEGYDATYSGMGRSYRKIQLDSGKFKPFKERMKNNKALQQIAMAMPHRIEPHGVLKMGIRNRTPSPEKDFSPADCIGKFTPMLPFNKAKELIDTFKAAGMTDVHFIDAGWQCGGYDGRCPQIFPIEEALGGEKALKDFIKYTQSLGYQICSNSNHTDAYTNSDMWDKDYICKRYDGSLLCATVYKGGNMYYICTKRSLELFIKKQLEDTRKLGYEGILYIDVFSARAPDQCFDPKHTVNRREQAEAQKRVLAYARKLFGGAASECGFEHCLEELDYVNYLGRHMLNGEGFGDKQFKRCTGINDKPKYNILIDRIAPLWELVYHGIVLSNPDKFTQDYRPKGTTNHLRLIEFGGRPIFYSIKYSPDAMAKYKEMYDAFQPLKHLQLEFMEENRELAKDVYLTRYSDGSEVITNYSLNEFTYKDYKVKARDYFLVKPEKKN